MLRWIAFDAVGTLIYPEPDVATAYAHIGAKYGSHLTPTDLRLRFRSVFAESTVACLPVDDGHTVTNEPLEVERWRWIVARMLPDVTDPETCFDELYDHFARPDHWRLFDDVAETLTELRSRGIRIAIASNFDQRLHAVCRGFSEFGEVEHIVVSTEAGACKPSSRFYAALKKACDCRPEEMLMVGDEYESDVAGPLQANIPAVWLDRTATQPGKPPRTIRLLTELL